MNTGLKMILIIYMIIENFLPSLANYSRGGFGIALTEAG